MPYTCNVPIRARKYLNGHLKRVLLENAYEVWKQMVIGSEICECAVIVREGYRNSLAPIYSIKILILVARHIHMHLDIASGRGQRQSQSVRPEH